MNDAEEMQQAADDYTKYMASKIKYNAAGEILIQPEVNYEITKVENLEDRALRLLEEVTQYYKSHPEYHQTGPTGIHGIAVAVTDLENAHFRLRNHRFGLLIRAKREAHLA